MMSGWKLGSATFAVLLGLATSADAQVFAGANGGFNQGFGNAGFGQPFGGGFNQGFGQPFGGGFNQGFGQPFGGGVIGNQGFGLGGGPALGQNFQREPQMVNGLGVLSTTIQRQVVSKRSRGVRRRR